MTTECIQELMSLLGPDQIRLGQDIDASYQKDWSPTPKQRPLAVVMPTSTEQLAAAVRICASHQQIMVPQGGRTGLAGGATPPANAICISCEKLTTIEDIDPLSNTLTVQAGVTLQQVQDTALSVDRTFPVDFGARGSCQIGGVLATNAGGNNVIRYGVARDNVLGMEVVTASGTIVDLSNKMIKNNTGYDLKQLFIGSEGTLGFITKATLKLSAVPGEPRTALCALSGYADGVALLRHLQTTLSHSIHAFEMMWDDFYNLSCSWFCDGHPPVDAGYPLYVLVECRDCEEDTFNQAMESAFEAELIQDAAIAASLREREKLWQIREATTEFPTRLSLINFDISLPIKDIGDFVEQCRQRITAKWPQANVINFGHIGDSNLHLSIDKRFVEVINDLDAEELVYACVEDYQGSISAEHGIGIIKRDFLHHSVSSDALVMMKTLKEALDPDNLLNPGKIVNIDAI